MTPSIVRVSRNFLSSASDHRKNLRCLVDTDTINSYAGFKMTRLIQSSHGECGGNPQRGDSFSSATRTKLHEKIEFVHLCAVACSSERLRARKRKILEMLHKPLSTKSGQPQSALANHLHQLAATCTRLHQLAVKIFSSRPSVFIRGSRLRIPLMLFVGAVRTNPDKSGQRPTPLLAMSLMLNHFHPDTIKLSGCCSVT